MIFSALFSVIAVFCLHAHAGDVQVKGYYRKDGTYVAPHVRSSPNNTVTDNYSYRAPETTIPRHDLPTDSTLSRSTLCADGWVSTSTGSGACSHHGGFAAAGGISADPRRLVGVPIPDPKDTGYSYSRLANGDYAVLRSGQRTGTAVRGTVAWASIRALDETKSELTANDVDLIVAGIRQLGIPESEKQRLISAVRRQLKPTR